MFPHEGNPAEDVGWLYRAANSILDGSIDCACLVGLIWRHLCCRVEASFQATCGQLPDRLLARHLAMASWAQIRTRTSALCVWTAKEMLTLRPAPAGSPAFLARSRWLPRIRPAPGVASPSMELSRQSMAIEGRLRISNARFTNAAILMQTVLQHE